MSLGLGLTAMAQKIEVSGTVTDERNEPLVGVCVYEKGTTNGVMTDLDGRYSIKCDSNATLVFSMISFKDQEIPVKGRLRIDVVVMKEDGTGGGGHALS